MRIWVCPGGTLALVGAPTFGSTAPLDVASVVNKSLPIVGMVEGDSRADETIPALVREIESGRLPIDRLVDEHPFADVAAVMATMARRADAFKPVLVIPH